MLQTIFSYSQFLRRNEKEYDAQYIIAMTRHSGGNMKPHIKNPVRERFCKRVEIMD